MVSEIVAAWPRKIWQRLAVMEGEKGSIIYDWACQPVVESRDQLPGPDIWRLSRRSISKPDERAYYLCYAPPATPLPVLIWVASSRYTVEQCIKEAKGETGLDEYEVRFWHSWHRHITLSMMAHAWLASIHAAEREKKAQLARNSASLTVPEVRRLLEIALPLPKGSADLRLAWSRWRRRKRLWARQSHSRRRACLARTKRPRNRSP